MSSGSCLYSSQPYYFFSLFFIYKEKKIDTERYRGLSPNAGKYGQEKTPYLDTFHAVSSIDNDEKHVIHSEW